MELFIPLFPLNLVAFPGEKLNLHIFEPRYKQLVNDCLVSGLSFGVPSFVHNKIEYGTEMTIQEVVKTYDDGRMDIKTIGSRIIKVEEFTNPAEGKKYSCGTVTPLPDIDNSTAETKEEMIFLLKELYQSLNMVEDVHIEDDTKSFDVGHHVGLSIEQEYEFIQLSSEKERQLYIIEHLKKAIPLVQNVEKAKERIKLNGHFKNLDPLDF